MTISKKTITFALLVVFILGLMAKIAFGATTYVAPIGQYDITASVPAKSYYNAGSLLDFSINANTQPFFDDDAKLSGNVRYFTFAIKNVADGLDSLHFNGYYHLTGTPQNTGYAYFTPAIVDISTLPHNSADCNLVTVDLGQNYNFVNGGLVISITPQTSGTYDLAICGSYGATNANFQNFMWYTTGSYETYYVCPTIKGNLYKNCDTNMKPFFILEETMPAIPPELLTANITIASDNTAQIAGTVSNYAGYNVIYVDIYDTATNTLVADTNAFGILTAGAFNLQLGALPAGAYTAHFTLTQLVPSTFISLATTYNFILANPIPPSVSNPTGVQSPAGTYTVPVNPEQYRLDNSDWPTGTALYAKFTNAIYPVINAVGQWSQTFNGRFLTADAITNGQAIGGGISTITAYASNLNGFFGNLPIVQALFVFLVFNLALAVLASIRFIIKLIK